MSPAAGVLESDTRSLPDLSIRFRWPGQGPSGECDNFFFGVWHPRRRIRVEWVGVPSVPYVSRGGPNWLLASAASPVHPAGTGLVHAGENGSGAAFRGYIVPRLHSYASGADVLQYWDRDLRSEHNGVFSTAVIGAGGLTLTLLTDVLGMGPLYYRSLGEATVFATNSRFLLTEEDGPDLVAWRSLIQTSWIVGDRSLCPAVKRLPAGHALTVSRDGEKVSAWFDFQRLPGGTRAVGPTAVAEVEEALEQAVGRCLDLQTGGGVVLPLSSGFDSRRMLAILMKKRVDFQAITCRTYQKNHRELDARFASEMSRDFGFAHQIVEPGSYQQYVGDDVARRVLVDAETREHSWAMSVMKALPARPNVFFDGIGGDILGDPVGWSVHVGLAIEDRSPDLEVDAIAGHSIRDTFDSILSPRIWPSVEDLRETVKSYVRPFLPRQNLSELAFLLLRQRRAIAPWSQQLVPPGQVPVCPYLDLDYLRLLLEFTSVDKHATKFQRACLREFWPQLYKYPGNRDIPESVPPGSPDLENNRALSCYAPMRDEMRARDGMLLLRELLTPKGRLVLRMSEWSRSVQIRGLWYLHPLMELVFRQAHIRPCWSWRGE
jgi:hypothetical protein